MIPVFHNNTGAVFALSAALVTASCGPSGERESNETARSQKPSAMPVADPATDTAPRATAEAPVLTLDGLADLRIGSPVPNGSGFADRGAQASESCLIFTSPDFTGVYAMVEQGVVRRITLGQRSRIAIKEGIQVGSSEAEVLESFPRFSSQPHKYLDAPGKYLTQPGNDPRLRFEIGTNRMVQAIHVGRRPQLDYVEGCA